MNKDEKAEKPIGIVQQKYKSGLSYFRQMKFLDDWPKYERFKAGDQWPPPTDRTRNMPRPVFNIIEFIQNHKVSTVMNENIKMVFSPMENVTGLQPTTPDEGQMMRLAEDAGEKFTRYSDTVWEEIKQDELNEEALESASNVGTGIWHYYWDDAQAGGNIRPYKGKMCGEILDPINVFFDNPQQRNVQKQPGITISSREMLKHVKEMAKRNGLSEEMAQMITPDKDTVDEGYDRAQIEVDGSEKVTVLTRYWKENGVVHFIKEASSQTVKPKTATGMKLYPIVVMQWKRRKKSIYGIGDTEGIIPNQVGINFLMAMMLLSVQGHGWPKMKVNPAYVDVTSLNNDPSVPIITNAPSGQMDVEYLTPGPVSGLARDLVEAFIDHTKTLSSAQDASTGEASSGQLNATAIMLLQKAAGVPIESIKKRFYRAMEDVGRVWEEFWKVKYNTTRRVNVQDDDGNEEATEFRGTDYADIDLNLKIDIGPSSQYSEQLMMASLDKLYDKQAIDTIQYLELAPKTVVPFRDRLIKQLKEQQAMQAQMAQQEAMMMQQNQPDPQQQLQEQMAINDQKHQQTMEVKEFDRQTKLEEAGMKLAAGR